MPNSPVAGLPYPATSDAPAGPAQLQALTTALDSVVLARFATTALRDSTITAPVNGQVVQCLDSGLWEYVTGSGWVSTGLRIATTKTSTAQATATTVTSQVNVPGIDGTVYNSSRRRLCRAALNAVISGDIGVQWRVAVAIDGTTQIDTRGVPVNATGPGAVWNVFYSLPFVVPAGSHGITCYVQRVSGSGNSVISSGAVLVVTDEGPA